MQQHLVKIHSLIKTKGGYILRVIHTNGFFKLFYKPVKFQIHQGIAVISAVASGIDTETVNIAFFSVEIHFIPVKAGDITFFNQKTGRGHLFKEGLPLENKYIRTDTGIGFIITA